MKKYNVEQKTDEWLKLRKGKVTGKLLKRIVGTPKVREGAYYELLAERLAVGNDVEESALDRGVRCEPLAIAEFEKLTGKVVEQIGFCESDQNPFMGFSPDGLIKNKKKYSEAVEVKCLSSANHVRAWLENKIPEEHYAQCIQAFIVNDELQTLYFVLYDSRVRVHPLHVIELHREHIEDDIADYKISELELIREVDEKLAEILKI